MVVKAAFGKWIHNEKFTGNSCSHYCSCFFCAFPSPDLLLLPLPLLLLHHLLLLRLLLILLRVLLRLFSIHLFCLLLLIHLLQLLICLLFPGCVDSSAS